MYIKNERNYYCPQFMSSRYTRAKNSREMTRVNLQSICTAAAPIFSDALVYIMHFLRHQRAIKVPPPPDGVRRI